MCVDVVVVVNVVICTEPETCKALMCGAIYSFVRQSASGVSSGVKLPNESER